MILAEGARRLYSTTYLANARGGAFIQNARTIVLGWSPVCLAAPSGSWMYTQEERRVKGAKGWSSMELFAMEC